MEHAHERRYIQFLRHKITINQRHQNAEAVNKYYEALKRVPEIGEDRVLKFQEFEKGVKNLESTYKIPRNLRFQSRHMRHPHEFDQYKKDLRECLLNLNVPQNEIEAYISELTKSRHVLMGFYLKASTISLNELDKLCKQMGMNEDEINACKFVHGVLVAYFGTNLSDTVVPPTFTLEEKIKAWQSLNNPEFDLGINQYTVETPDGKEIHLAFSGMSALDQLTAVHVPEGIKYLAVEGNIIAGSMFINQGMVGEFWRQEVYRWIQEQEAKGIKVLVVNEYLKDNKASAAASANMAKLVDSKTKEPITEKAMYDAKEVIQELVYASEGILLPDNVMTIPDRQKFNPITQTPDRKSLPHSRMDRTIGNITGSSPAPTYAGNIYSTTTVSFQSPKRDADSWIESQLPGVQTKDDMDAITKGDFSYAIRTSPKGSKEI